MNYGVGTKGRFAQRTGGSTQCFSIEDEESTSEASSRRVGGPSRGECAAVVHASLIIDPEFLGRGGWAN